MSTKSRVFRWSKTLSAYNQWAFIFEKELPLEVTTKQSALVVVTYIRDIITFAAENNLKGSEWYRKVTVSAIGTNTVTVRTRANQPRISTYPSKSIFEVMEMAQTGGLVSGYKFVSSAPMDELAELLESLSVEFRDLKNNLVEIT